MKGKKEAVWAVVISAAFITAGLILSCGDDDNGGNGNGEPEVTCEDICEKLIDCIWPDWDVEECLEDCEDEFDVEEEAMEVFECIVDIRCEYIGLDCFCKAIGERLVDCELIDEEELVYYVPECGMYYAGDPDFVLSQTMCVFENSCEDIEEACFP